MNFPSIKEFKPTIFFLTKFVGLYLVGNLLYGVYITQHNPRPDPVTQRVSDQVAVILSSCGWTVATLDHEKAPTTSLRYQGRSVLSVYEGCNGLNIMIIFVAFVVSFGRLERDALWFIPLGLLIIHGLNLLRIILLFYVAEYVPNFIYFTHKYLFTAFLYAAVFVLWMWWVRRKSKQQKA